MKQKLGSFLVSVLALGLALVRSPGVVLLITPRRRMYVIWCSVPTPRVGGCICLWMTPSLGTSSKCRAVRIFFLLLNWVVCWLFTSLLSPKHFLMSNLFCFCLTWQGSYNASLALLEIVVVGRAPFHFCLAPLLFCPGAALCSGLD